ncbi:lipase secretion chaperone [Duganella fentianensis]|uniref:lipase secretion chaperone n=1 Tax=Duganella fentianensis TaxID=2692177 RepID=UPI0032B12BE4
MTKAKRYGLILLAGAITIGAYLSWHQPAVPATATASAGARAGAGAGSPDYFAFVPSMLGTRPDGHLAQQEADQLVLSPELIYLFDYYLAALGEKPLDAIRTQIRLELARRLQGNAVAEAQRLLDAYIYYKRALASVEGQLGSSKDPVQAARQRLQAMRQTRASYFSAAESSALFGSSDAYDEDAIARMEISSDRQLSEAQRQQRWQQLDARLTPAQRAERAAPTRVLALEQSVAQARAQGADENQIYRLRASSFSPAAADRLAELDRDEADWQRRISSYQKSRLALLQQGRDQTQALQQLRDASFSPAEQLRLGAYEQ